MKTTCYRNIELLRLLPIYPARKSTSELLGELEAQGFELTIRTLQRDLRDLQKLFPIENDGCKDIPGWYWIKDAKKLELPQMEPAAALTFKMVQQFLLRFMPPDVLQSLQGYMDNANQVLENLDSPLSDWPEKVQVISRTQPLLAPTIKAQVLDNIYQALLKEKQIEAKYRPIQEAGEIKTYLIHPLGIVIDNQVLYLVGTIDDYKDVRQFALHRFEKALCTETSAQPLPDFSLADYIQQGNFAFPLEQGENQKIQLKLKASPWLTAYLSERKLSEDQVIEPLESEQETGAFIRATVLNTAQLRWWLWALAHQLEVIEPTELRSEFKNFYQQQLKKYQVDSGTN